MAPSLVSLSSVGAGLGMARTARGSTCLCSTDKLSSATTSGALLIGEGGGALGRLAAAVFTTTAGTALLVSGCRCCFKLRTSEAPAAEAVMQTTNAMHADTQRGRSLSPSAA